MAEFVVNHTKRGLLDFSQESDSQKVSRVRKRAVLLKAIASVLFTSTVARGEQSEKQRINKIDS